MAILKSVFLTNDNPDADLNGDAKADFADLAVLKSMFFTEPGPSGLVLEARRSTIRQLT